MSISLKAIYAKKKSACVEFIGIVVSAILFARRARWGLASRSLPLQGIADAKFLGGASSCLPALFLAVVLVGAGWDCLSAVAVEQPNIILIVTDDQGYWDTGISGNPDIETPNMDRLAKDGVQFSRFYFQNRSI